VSGELFVALRFMEELRRRRIRMRRFVLSTNTSTGHALAERIAHGRGRIDLLSR